MLNQTGLYPQFTLTGRASPALVLPLVFTLLAAIVAPSVLGLLGTSDAVALPIVAVVDLAAALGLLGVVARRTSLRVGRADGRLPLLRVVLYSLGCAAAILLLGYWTRCRSEWGCQIAVEPLSLAQVAVATGQVMIEEVVFRLALPLVLAATIARLLVTDRSRVAAAVGLFALWHFPTTLAAALDHAAFGLLMVVLFTRTRSIAAPIVFHLANNLVAMTVDISSPGVPAEPSLIVVAFKYAAWFALLLVIDPELRRRVAMWCRSIWADRADLGPDSVQGPNRLLAVDALRNLALLLIVCENALLFLPGETVAGLYTQSEAALRVGFGVLVEYRGLGLFTVLLGFSLAVARTRAALSTARGVSVQSVRARALIFLGLCQGALWFPFDILVTFGIVIALMLRFGVRDGRVRPLWWMVAAVGLVPSYGLGFTTAQLPVEPTLQQFVFASTETVADLRAEEWAVSLIALPLSVGPALLPAALGYAIGGRAIGGRAIGGRAVDGRASWIRSRRVLAAAVLGSVALTVPHGLALAADAGSSALVSGDLVAELLASVGSVGAAAALLMLAVELGRDRNRHTVLSTIIGVLAPGGQNTLTGYLLSSAVLVILLPPFGADVARRVSLGWLLLIVLALWGAYVMISWAFFNQSRMAAESVVAWITAHFSDPRSPVPVSVDGVRSGGPAQRFSFGTRREYAQPIRPTSISPTRVSSPINHGRGIDSAPKASRSTKNTTAQPTNIAA